MVRRRLPAARAVAGGFCVALAAVLVFGAYLGSRPTASRRWLVTRVPLAAGTALGPSDLTTAAASLGPTAAASRALAAGSAPYGRVLAVDLPAGALLTATDLEPAHRVASRPVPISVPSADVVDLSAGDLVDVLVTTGGGSSPGHTTIVDRGARVLAIEPPSGGLVASGTQQVVVLGVSTLAEVESVVAAGHSGSVDVVVGEPSDGRGLGPG